MPASGALTSALPSSAPVNTLMFLMAPVTAVWGVLMFGEPFGPQTAFGLAVGLLAVVIVHRGDTSATTVRAGHGHEGGHEAATYGA